MCWWLKRQQCQSRVHQVYWDLFSHHHRQCCACIMTEMHVIKIQKENPYFITQWHTDLELRIVAILINASGIVWWMVPFSGTSLSFNHKPAWLLSHHQSLNCFCHNRLASLSDVCLNVSVLWWTGDLSRVSRHNTWARSNRGTLCFI